jgi:hypothetical protein
MTSRIVRQPLAQEKHAPNDQHQTVIALLEQKHPSYDMLITRSNAEGGCLVVTFTCVPKEGLGGAGLSSCKRVACINLDGAGNPVNVFWTMLLPEQEVWS